MNIIAGWFMWPFKNNREKCNCNGCRAYRRGISGYIPCANLQSSPPPMPPVKPPKERSDLERIADSLEQIANRMEG